MYLKSCITKHIGPIAKLLPAQALTPIGAGDMVVLSVKRAKLELREKCVLSFGDVFSELE